MKQLHGGDLTTYREGYPDTPLLDFSANINPLGLPESIGRVLAECAGDCIHYPDHSCRGLRRALSAFEGVPDQQILCGNGAADLIYRIAYAVRPARAVVLSPTFVEYELALSTAGCQVSFHPLSEENGFVVDESLLGCVDGAQLVFVCNPNNPTGLLADPALLDKLLHRCEKAGTLLVVDECFIDFVDDPAAHTLKHHLDSARNLVILKAFTKLFAMPGLRLGYLLCGEPALLTRIRDAGPPWSVSVPAQRCGIAAAGEAEYLARTRREMPGLRRRLADGLRQLGFLVIPGQANYLLFRARPGLVESLHPHGILLRDCSAMRGLGAGWYRTAVRTEKENDSLLSALLPFSDK